MPTLAGVLRVDSRCAPSSRTCRAKKIFTGTSRADCERVDAGCTVSGVYQRGAGGERGACAQREPTADAERACRGFGAFAIPQRHRWRCALPRRPAERVRRKDVGFEVT